MYIHIYVIYIIYIIQLFCHTILEHILTFNLSSDMKVVYQL